MTSHWLDLPIFCWGEQQSRTRCKSCEPPAFHRNIPPQHIRFVISCMCDQSSMCLNARVKSYLVHRQMVTPLFQHHLPLPPSFKKKCMRLLHVGNFLFCSSFRLLIATVSHLLFSTHGIREGAASLWGWSRNVVYGCQLWIKIQIQSCADQPEAGLTGSSGLPPERTLLFHLN